MENMDRKVERMVRRSAKRRLWKRFVAIPAAVVVFVTTYALILPAIALEGDTYCGIEPHRHTEECYTAELACGYEDGAVVQDVETWMELACAAQPHQHTEACYDETGNVICGYADYFIHEHNADCYDASGALICPLPEVKAHVHDESCYVTETVNVCGQEESAGHVHDAGCYTLVSHPELICGQEESVGHVHDESCYTTTENTYLACGTEESAGHVHDESCYTVTVAEDGTETMELTCGQEESVGHTHTEACYITEPVTELTCGQEESVGHVHTDACFANVETMELTCGQEESPGHTHTEACFAQQQRLVCAQPEVIPHVHSDECWTVTGYAEDGSEIRALTCGMTEVATHVHTAECFATYETTVERPHQHTDLCYVQVLTCTLPEHEHTAECYVAPEPTAAPEASEEPIDGETAEEPADGEAAEEPVDGEAAEEPADGEASEEPVDGEASEEPVDGEAAEEPTDGEADEEPIDGESAQEPEYICGKEEHTHGEACFDENDTLICQIEEHTHDESCLAEVVEIIEDELAPAEEPEYICGKEEHTHGEECFDENDTLICQIEEHTHDETCLGEVVDIEDGATPLLDRLVLICDKEEHVHGPECMNEALEYICGKEVHEHTAECYATVSDDGKIVYCGIAEHTHDGNCYDANGLLICQLPEHTHDELCFLPPEAAELKYAATRQVKTFENDDVLVTAVYGPEANIPVQSELFVYQVTEQSDPERYAQRVAEMKAMLMPETLEDVPAEADLEVEEPAEEPPILIYNIGFYMNGVEIEPEAPVTVTVHVLNKDHMPTGESYAIVHFAATGTEVLENTVDDAGAATFTTESFSDFGVALRDAETGADAEPLPEPEAQSSEPEADETQTGEPVVSEPQDQSAEVPQDQSTEVPQDQSTEVPQDQSTEVPQDQSTEVPQDQSTEVPQDQSTEAPQDQSTEVPQDQSTEVPQDQSTEVPQNGEAAQDPEIGDDPSATTYAAQNINNDYGIMPIATVSNRPYVWFDGTLGMATAVQDKNDRKNAYNNTYYTNGTTKTPNIRKQVDNPSDRNWNSNQENMTVTLPLADQVKHPSGYTLGGWYDIKTGEYYAPGVTVTVGTWTRHTGSGGGPGSGFHNFGGGGDNATYTWKFADIYDDNHPVFYADWWPSDSAYDITSEGTEGPNTEGIIKTEVYDFNETLNWVRNYAAASIKSDNDKHSETWTTSGFAFANTYYQDKLANNGATAKSIGYPGGVNYTNAIYGNDADSVKSLFDSIGSTTRYGVKDLGAGNGLFLYDEDSSYYYFDSTKTNAQYNGSGHKFYLNDVRDGQFFPFGENNYWFGMKNTITFSLPATSGGETGQANVSEANEPMKFAFSGDDDVLVYVDGQLVLNMAGIHGKVYGQIDFTTGECTVSNSGTYDTKGRPTPTEGKKTTFNFAEGEHTLTVYYLERGSEQSNCAIYFNMAASPKANGGTNTGKGMVDGVKTIDYLGDNGENQSSTVQNGYVIPGGTNTDDLYRLYLTASNDRTANPINVLLILDVSGSMGNNGGLDSLKTYLGQKGGLIDTILPTDNSGRLTTDNKLAIVTFSGQSSTYDTSKAYGDANYVFPWDNVKGQYNRNGGGAKGTVYGLSSGGGTNYTRALQVAQTALQELLNNGRSQYQTFVLFLSDGAPTNSVDEYGYRLGNGSSTITERGWKEAYDTTIEEINDFNSLMDKFPQHTVRAVAYDTDVTEFLNSIDGTGETISTTDLTSAIEKALQLTPVSKVVIQDKLSKWVDFAGEADKNDEITDVEVHLIQTDGNKRDIPVWANGADLAWLDDAHTVPYVQSVTLNPNTKQIEVKFTPGYVLPNNYKLELSFNIRVNDDAFEYYATHSGSRYPDQGHPNTDYGQNKTSSGQPGFFSNDEAGALMQYRQDNKNNTVKYDKPVVQVWRPTLTITKYGPEDQELLDGATFTLTKDGDTAWEDRTYTTGMNGDAGKFTIDDLSDGTYTLRETAAPASYEVSSYALSFTVKHGMIELSMYVVDSSGKELTEGTGGWSIHNDVNWHWNSPTNPNYPDSKWVFAYNASLTDEKSTIKLQIIKAEEGTSKEEPVPVTGAVFNLYKDVNENSEVDEGDELIAGNVSSNGDGQLVFNGLVYKELDTGHYLLEETAVPDGFNLLQEPIVIHITHDGEGFHVTYSGPYIQDGGRVVPPAEELAHDYWQITVYNTYGYELPETGGEGTAMYTLGGIALIALAGAMLCDRRRKAARG